MNLSYRDFFAPRTLHYYILFRAPMTPEVCASGNMYHLGQLTTHRNSFNFSNRLYGNWLNPLQYETFEVIITIALFDSLN